MKKAIFAFAVLMFFGSSTAWALFSAGVSYQITSNGASNYTYNFTVKNTSTEAGNLDFFGIFLDADPDYSLYSNVIWGDAKGWADYAMEYDPAFGTLSAAVLADDSILGANGGGIGQGASLGVFQFDFDYAGSLLPSQQLFSWNAEFDTNFDGNGIGIGDPENPDYWIAGSASGTSRFIPSEPPAVPEPSTIALVGLGLAGLCLFRRKNK